MVQAEVDVLNTLVCFQDLCFDPREPLLNRQVEIFRGDVEVQIVPSGKADLRSR
ncbi:hypothetical protein D3C76_1777110 [compost metagenome]